LKLVTKPAFTGSVPLLKMIGIFAVADLAALAGSEPPVAIISEIGGCHPIILSLADEALEVTKKLCGIT
jgi:hypothetical protein